MINTPYLTQISFRRVLNIKRILNQSDLLLRQRTKKYYNDDDIFEEINTPEKAYWLGFLAADGCNY